MQVDYDLVVIGNSLEGITAATIAANLKARVALVEQTSEEPQNLAIAPEKSDRVISESIYLESLTYLGRLSQQLAQARQLGIYPTASQEIQLSQVNPWIACVDATVTAEQNSIPRLSALGIDFIKGKGEFCRLPHLEFVIGRRKLRSRSYLIATGSYTRIPTIIGLNDVGYLTPRDLWQGNKLSSLPRDLAMIGDSLASIELAQSLTRLGKKITLILESDRLLPTEDIEAANLIQAQLEAEGIRILVQSPVIQIKRIEDKKWVQAGDRAIETDEIILCTASQPNIAGLNLDGVGVEVGKRGIRVNPQLQTSHPRIYACGSAIGGYPLTNIACYEASVAVKNALFFPWWQVDYGTIPYVIASDPPLARVGMTEKQATDSYGEDVKVVWQYFKTIARSQILGETTGFCKFVLRRNGEILGAHIVGAEAGELIGSIALAMKQNLKISAIANLSYPGLSRSEILQKSAIEWQHYNFKRHKNWQKWLETLFIWQRKW